MTSQTSQTSQNSKMSQKVAVSVVYVAAMFMTIMEVMCRS